MNKFPRFLIGIVALALPAVAAAQSPVAPSSAGPFYAPNWYTGYTPTSLQWKYLLSNKMDYFPSGIPLQYGGTGVTSLSALQSLLASSPAPGAFSSLSVSGNDSIDGTLNVTGTATFAGSVSGAGISPAGATTLRSLSARFAETENVLDFGAKGDGVTDDTAAIQAAENACPATGCILYFPPGHTYGIKSAILLSSNTHVVAYGATILDIGGQTGLFTNLHNTATTLTDSNITIEGGTYDYGASMANGGQHAIQFNFVKHAQVLNAIGQGRGALTPATGTFTVSGGQVTSVSLTSGGSTYVNGTYNGLLIFNGAGGSGASGSYTASGGAVTSVSITNGGSGYTNGTYPLTFASGAGDFVAMIGCDDVLVQGNSAFGFDNAAYDFWWAPTNVRLIGNYAISGESAQMVNFNPDPTFGSSTGLVANGFVMSGNTFVATSANAIPMQLEPLASGSAVKNVSVTGNVFNNVYLVSRGAMLGETISGNMFVNVAGGVSAVFSYPNYGSTPDSITVSGNSFVNPQTAAGNLAVIFLSATNSSITGNIISGSSYYAATYTGTYPVVISGNSFPSSAYQNTGSAWISENGPFIVTGNASIGGTLGITGKATFSGLVSVSSATGITAHAGGGQASATPLVAQVNLVSTVATAADSVKLPASASGLCITVINGAANALQLFGAGSDTINGAAAATGVSVAAGKTGHYCSAAAGTWFGGTLN